MHDTVRFFCTRMIIIITIFCLFVVAMQTIYKERERQIFFKQLQFCERIISEKEKKQPCKQKNNNIIVDQIYNSRGYG